MSFAPPLVFMINKFNFCSESDIMLANSRFYEVDSFPYSIPICPKFLLLVSIVYCDLGFESVISTYCSIYCFIFGLTAYFHIFVAVSFHQ